jgi:hypothetical protein
MFALPATSRLSALGFFEFRLATLAAYGGSLILLHYAELLAEKVYNDLCSREGITFGEPMSAMSLAFVLVALFLPTLLARSRALIVANLAASLITAGGAVLLLFTASHTPYECFTMGGTYEDHTSGLGEFALWGAFVLLLSFALLFIDLSVWAFKNVAACSE